MKTQPKVIRYQVSGRDDAGIWMHFSIPGNEYAEIITFVQPEGHFDSGIFNRATGYEKVMIKEPLLSDGDETGEYVLKIQS